MHAVTLQQVAVLGAGIVGVCCALELQRRGFSVTLIDRRGPGQETSYGNAGVLARSSVVPLNNPGLLRALPSLLANRSTSLRYAPRYLVRHLPWALRFLANSQGRRFDDTTIALDALIRLSMRAHRNLLGDAGELRRLRDSGYLNLYRSATGYAGSALARRVYDQLGIAHQTLDAKSLRALEPHLSPVFSQALWLQDNLSVDNPGQVVEAYARIFCERGGRLERREVLALQPAGDGRWQLHSADGGTTQVAQVVVALGPWARDFLAPLGLHLPMVYERGYHMHYRARDGAHLGRPVYDTEGGYVLAPMEQGMRLTTGVELAAIDAPPGTAQLALAESAARTAFPLADRLDKVPWLGRRPTLPDSRPMIGAAPRHPGLWLAVGHQHIGFSTGPGSALLLAALMTAEAPPIDPLPFRPGRYL